MSRWQTLRHLVFVHDSWFRHCCLEMSTIRSVEFARTMLTILTTRPRSTARQVKPSTGWPVIPAINTKSLSLCRTVRRDCSAMAATIRSGTEGARC